MKITAKFHLEASILGEVEIEVSSNITKGQAAACDNYGRPTECATAPSVDIIDLFVDGTQMDMDDAARMFSLSSKEFEQRCEEEAWEEYTDWS